LSDNAIQSAPVRDGQDGEYIGFVDQLDMVTYVLQMVAGTSGEEVNWAAYTTEIKTLQHRGVRLGITPLKKVISAYLMIPAFVVILVSLQTF